VFGDRHPHLIEQGSHGKKRRHDFNQNVVFQGKLETLYCEQGGKKAAPTQTPPKFSEGVDRNVSSFP
jgi:hypothetical protein